MYISTALELLFDISLYRLEAGKKNIMQIKATEKFKPEFKMEG